MKPHWIPLKLTNIVPLTQIISSQLQNSLNNPKTRAHGADRNPLAFWTFLLWIHRFYHPKIANFSHHNLSKSLGKRDVNGKSKTTVRVHAGLSTWAVLKFVFLIIPTMFTTLTAGGCKVRIQNKRLRNFWWTPTSWSKAAHQDFLLKTLNLLHKQKPPDHLPTQPTVKTPFHNPFLPRCTHSESRRSWEDPAASCRASPGLRGWRWPGSPCGRGNPAGSGPSSRPCGSWCWCAACRRVWWGSARASRGCSRHPAMSRWGNPLKHTGGTGWVWDRLRTRPAGLQFAAFPLFCLPGVCELILAEHSSDFGYQEGETQIQPAQVSNSLSGISFIEKPLQVQCSHPLKMELTAALGYSQSTANFKQSTALNLVFALPQTHEIKTRLNKII